jgi:hypothetical protein
VLSTPLANTTMVFARKGSGPATMRLHQVKPLAHTQWRSLAGVLARRPRHCQVQQGGEEHGPTETGAVLVLVSMETVKGLLAAVVLVGSHSRTEALVGSLVSPVEPRYHLHREDLAAVEVGLVTATSKQTAAAEVAIQVAPRPLAVRALAVAEATTWPSQPCPPSLTSV